MATIYKKAVDNLRVLNAKPITTKNIQDVVAEFFQRVKPYPYTPMYELIEKESDWLTTTLTQLVKEIEMGERDRIAQWAKQKRKTQYVHDFTEEVIVYEDLIEALTPPTND